MRRFGIARIARATGFAAIGIAIVMATAVHLRRGDLVTGDRAASAIASPPDPLARELAHCRAIGITANDAAACKAAWAENRRRFFAPLWDRPPAGSARPQSEAR